MAIKMKDLPIGTLVKDNNTLLFGDPIIWRIVDKNHQDYPDNSVTLICDGVIGSKAYDAVESNNPYTTSGWNKYSVSNIHQWLNSDGNANEWYQATHQYDTAPKYINKAGFLNNFSSYFKQALLPTSVICKIPVGESETDFETIISTIFLPSTAELGITNYNVIEGSQLAFFTDNTSRQAKYNYAYLMDFNGNNQTWVDNTFATFTIYATRSPRTYGLTSSGDSSVWNINNTGDINSSTDVGSLDNMRPLCNITDSLMVTDTSDNNGVYTIIPIETTYIYRPDINDYLMANQQTYIYTNDKTIIK